MRVATADQRVLVTPGAAAGIRVDVHNDDAIIDGLKATVIGPAGLSVVVEPEMLTVFPGAAGEIVLHVTTPGSLTAGPHHVVVALESAATKAVHHLDVLLDVEPRPAVALRRTPRLVRGKRSGRFHLEVANEGNVPFEATLSAPPTERGVQTRVTPETLVVGPGQVSHALAVVRGPRMITGAEIDRSVTVQLVARRAGTGAQGDAVETGLELSDSAVLALRQRPRLSRGLITALVLLGIVGMWAAVFSLGLLQAFGGDQAPKSASASFFVEEPDASSTTTDQGELLTVGVETNTLLLGKTGVVPVDVGGEIGGVVSARSNNQPVGRVVVEAFRRRSDGTLTADPVSTAATLDDGSFSLVGLFPTDYLLRFSGDGFATTWFPDAATSATATPLVATAQGSTENNPVVMKGSTGSLTGQVDPGSVEDPAPTRVTAKLLDDADAADGTVATTSVTTVDGRYTFPRLRAPGTYELTFETEGYQLGKVVQTLAAGEDRSQPTVLLSAGDGSIGGLVEVDGQATGGVTVSTTVDGEPISVVTPTSGVVGRYDLTGLPTPGTYLLTFAAADNTTTTEVVRLAAGQGQRNVDVSLDSGTGVVTGTVKDTDGTRLPGVQVTVGGVVADDGSVPTTATLTAGADKGTFAINDLAPGTYTLTFTADGYDPATLPVVLEEGRPTPKVDVQMTQRLGSLQGLVTTDGGTGLTGASILVTDGTLVVTATSSSASGPGDGVLLKQGEYLVPGLPPGVYSVTATYDGRKQQTTSVRVEAGSRPTTVTKLSLVED